MLAACVCVSLCMCVPKGAVMQVCESVCVLKCGAGGFCHRVEPAPLIVS